jgi:hypothetical protein
MKELIQSMILPDEEIPEESEHLRKMLRTLRRYRREREQQAVTYGIEVPPHVSLEIRTLNEQILQKEHELTQLETLAAVDRYSLVEAEYRKLLAEELNTSNGYLGVVVSSRIELARLKLGLVREKADELEADVRSALTRETLFYVDKHFLTNIQETEPEVMNEIYREQHRMIASLRSAIWLFDYETKLASGSSKALEKERDVIEAFQEINKQKGRFKGINQMKDVQDARIFMDSQADEFLRQQGKNAERSLIVDKILYKVEEAIRRVMRSIRLDYVTAYQELSANYSLSSQNIGLLTEVLAIAKVHPGDEEIIQQFISKIDNTDDNKVLKNG